MDVRAGFLNVPLSKHAFERIGSRRVSLGAVASVLNYGREVHARGAVIYAIGRNEVEMARNRGVDLREEEGIHVVCSREGLILTVYRNRSLSDLRPRRGKSYCYPRRYWSADSSIAA
jgi:hypothetical protein